MDFLCFKRTQNLNQIIKNLFDFAWNKKTLLNMATRNGLKKTKNKIKKKLKLIFYKFFKLHYFFHLIFVLVHIFKNLEDSKWL